MTSVPPQVGRYQVQAELGRGGMGVVYRALDPSLDRPVALKVLPEEFARDPDRLERFRREARILASLNHPNIASIYSLEETEDHRQLLVLELVEGSDLHDRLRAGPLPVREALRVGAQIARALEAAHGRGVVHRDLKPQNIKVTPEQVVKVLDFGIARRDAPQPGGGEADATVTMAMATQPGMVMGTPGYMSPEQARGMAVDLRSDLFSFGCVLFECLAGKLTFDGQTALDRLVAVMTGNPNWSLLPPDLPPSIRPLLERCLNKEPEGRPPSAGEILLALEDALSQGPAATQTTVIRAPVVHNLPRQISRFVGRRREMDELEGLLRTSTLLTLVGVGGCGKTRLALQVAERTAETFPGGVWLAELAAISDPERLPMAIAKALRLQEEPGRHPVDTIKTRIAGHPLLLILDNCEHLVDACRSAADELLQACPNLKILATSREGLGLAGEVTWPVPSLTLGAGSPGLDEEAAEVTPEEALESEAVQLFVDRARSAVPAFELSDSNASWIARICRRLDGIPLAIELAAPRVRVLSVEQIHEKLDDRFRLLTGGSRSALSRHQTLRAAIDWSYSQLTEEEKTLLQSLSVFAGGWTLESAIAVCCEEMDEFEALDLMTHLVDKSLVAVSASHRGARRYSFLENIRQYAREELDRSGHAVEVRNRHQEHYLTLGGEAKPKFRGPEQGLWLDRVQTEHENFLAALRWSLSSKDQAAKGLQLCGDIWWFWLVRGYFTLGRKQLREVLEKTREQGQKDLRAAALNALGSLAGMQGDFPASREALEEGLALARDLDDRTLLANSLSNLGLVSGRMGDRKSSRQYHEESLALRRELGDPLSLGVSLNNLGALASDHGDFKAAQEYFTESLAIQRAAGNRHGEAILLSNLGMVARNLGKPEESRAFYEQGLALHREMKNQSGEAQCLNALGVVAMKLGDLDGAESHYQDSLRLHRAKGDRPGMAECLNNLGSVAMDRKDLARARELFEESRSTWEELELPMGRAVALGNLAFTSRLEGKSDEARRLFLESLRIRREADDRAGLPSLLERIALLAMDLGEVETSAWLLAGAERTRGQEAGEDEEVSQAWTTLGTRIGADRLGEIRHSAATGPTQDPLGEAVERAEIWLKDEGPHQSANFK